jgi:hypothetical protein
VVNCNATARSKSNFCTAHGGGVLCLVPGCRTGPVVGGKEGYCIAHGGGKRCIAPGCSRGARDKTNYCITHGGGKLCLVPDCDSSKQGKSGFCIYHGGGNRCPRCINTLDARNGYKRFDFLCGRCYRESGGSPLHF